MCVQEAGFDPDKTLCCSVENSQTLVHGPGGRGYGLGTTGITSGTYSLNSFEIFRPLKLLSAY